MVEYPGARSRGGGIGIGRGGGSGSGYGQGVGAGFGGFISGLRKNGLDVVLVIDGTGSMKLIIDSVKDRMKQLVLAIHRMVPAARIGIAVFGGRGEPILTQPLTISPDRLISFLNSINAHDGGEWQEDTLGAVRTAVDKMDWRQSAACGCWRGWTAPRCPWTRTLRTLSPDPKPPMHSGDSERKPHFQ